MGRRWARGSKSFAIDDRSGWKVPYKNLRTEWTGVRVTKTMFELKHPQLTPPRIISEAQALRDPRPDVVTDEIPTQLNEIIDMTFGGAVSNALLTEDGQQLTTEAGEVIVTEGM